VQVLASLRHLRQGRQDRALFQVPDLKVNQSIRIFKMPAGSLPCAMRIAPAAGLIDTGSALDRPDGEV
jgi:hypothetical protein